MTDPDAQYKVARVIDTYDLEGLGDELAERWTAEGDEHASLRELADRVNRSLLERVLDSNGAAPATVTVDEVYRHLSDESASSGARTETRKRLERAGVDVDAVTSDFVSYQAVRTYLLEGREVEYEAESSAAPDEAIRTIERLQGRTATVTENRIRRLAGAGVIAVGDFRPIVTTNVICEDCGIQYEATELIRRGSCECGGTVEAP